MERKKNLTKFYHDIYLYIYVTVKALSSTADSKSTKSIFIIQIYQLISVKPRIYEIVKSNPDLFLYFGRLQTIFSKS